LGSSTSLSAIGGTTYTWTPTLGLDNAAIAAPNANPGVTTTYVVDISNGVCSATDTITVSVQTLSVAVSADTTVYCAGGSSILNAVASGTATYSWSPTTGLDNAAIASPVATPAATTTYIVTANDGVCSVTNNITITVNVPVMPIITASGATSFCDGGSVILSAVGTGLGFGWLPNLATTQTITVATSGCFTVTSVDANGCTATSTQTCVNVNPVPAAPTIVFDSNSGSLDAGVVAAAYNWTMGGSAITDNTQIITPQANGIYAVSAVSDSGCVSTASTSFNYIFTGLTPTISKGVGAVTCYPNPVKDVLNISINSKFNIQNSKFFIVDVVGNEVMNGLLTNQNSAFNIQHLKSGIYFVKVGNEVRKVVKE
jgi:hypothetical protein